MQGQTQDPSAALPLLLTMSGMANVNSASRPHYASSIPVPRASSQTRIHTPGASPQLRPRQQADLALSPQRGASPRRGKAAVSSRNSSPKAYRGRGTPRAAGPARELAGSVESLPSSPWNSPRVTPKTALSSQAGSRRAGETQSTQRKKTQEGIPVRHTRGRSPPQSSCYGETQIPGPPEGRMPPGCQGKDQRNIISKPPRCLEPDEGEASGTSSPVCSPVQSMRSSATPGVISFSSAHPQSQPITATVAPFQYRLQTDQEPGPVPQESWVLDGYTSPPSRTEDSFSCMDARIVHALLAGRMLGSSVKSVQPEVELSGGSGSGGDEGADESRGASRKAAAADGRGMLPKRAKAAGGSGSMAKASAAELKVFKSGSVDSRVPGGLPTSNLRKQKSLTNLSFLTDSEKKLQLYEPEWSDDMAKAPKGLGKLGPKGRETPLMSKTLSKSEHSLFQPKGGSTGGAKTPLAPLAPSLGKPSRIPRGPYAEVKPLSKAPEAAVSDDGKSDDELLSSKAKAQKGSGTVPSAKGQEERAFLKVDPELVVTVLGDLEQLLFSQMLDPESQRKRTVQNVLDLRQNLEETMSSLRGSQVTHSSLEMPCYDSDDANPRSVSSLSNRSSPLSWRYGQSSPRLQAGDAPSVGGSCRSEGPPAWYMHGERAHYSHTMPMRSPSKLSHISRLELVESLDSDEVDLKSGYMSDSDLMGKTMTEDDDITTGWDESSSISSGLSDASDNLSSEEFNASSSLNSLPTTPTASRRSSTIVLRTDSEKRSLAESGLNWFSESEEKTPKKLEYDSGSLKMEPGTSKWRRERPESCDDASKGGELKKPISLGHPGSLKKGKTPPVAVTSPITHTAQSALKVAGKPEGKATDKGKLAVKNTGLQRSSSDAGRDRLSDAKKPPSGIARPSTSGSFGYKKPPPATGTATVMQTGSSATLSKIQKSSGIPVKPVNGRKTSLDVSNSVEPGFLAPGARSNIQYRSLPRPAKSSSMSVTGRGGPRPVSSSIDPSLLSTKQGGLTPSRLKEPSKVASGRSTPAPVNQTDREKEKAKAKAVALDSDNISLKSIGSPESTPKNQASHPPATKLAELPPTPLRATAKSFVKPPSLANLDKVNSNSLDLPSSSDTHASKVPDLHAPSSSTGGPLPSCFTPSPAPILNINSASFSQGLELMSGFSVPKETRMYPKLSGLHRSMESLQMPMSLPSAFPSSAPIPTPPTAPSEEDTEELPWSGSPRAGQLDSSQRDRNTLPKKGLRYQLQSQEETKERRHSHTAGGLPESDDQAELPSPPALSMSLSAKGQLTNIVSPTAATTPRITRSNSIPTHEAAFELYSGSQMGSTLSLAERPKGMIRSGSFRDPTDDVHGSVLSLASSASSTYSSQIRKLRRELESSQEKVATLTSQLSANANLVAAFEQSLVNMTSRLRHLAETAEEKDTELLDLRETIDFLKKKNSEAQAVIQGALNASEATPKELRIKRQNSSDSISSLNSITSHSSIGSSKDADAKKKKKKSWVYELRSSFNKAFSIKKGPKSASSYSDIEEIATPDSSAPSSPKLQHGSTETASPSIKSSTSSSVGTEVTETPAHSVPHTRLFQANEEEEPEKKEVSELRSELWEKEMKLTDIRLEALNSAHQLDQLRETMHNMQLEVDLLKAENDRLKVAPGPSSGCTPGQVPGSSALSSPRRSLGLALSHPFSPSLTDTDLSPMDGISTCGSKEEVTLRVVVRMPPQHIIKGDLKQQEFFLGCSKVSGKVDWKMLDEAVFQVFKDYISKMDPASTLGLSTESIHGYSLSHVKRVLDAEPPEMPPCRRGVNNISVALKGLKEKCVDSLVFETLIPKPMMQHYISLLLKHRRLVLSGPSGTGKTYLTNRLAEYLVERSGREVTDGIVSTFNMHQQSCKDLQLYLSNLANQIDRETGIGDVPLVILLDDLSEAGSISELVNGALTCKYHKCPYIIGTTNQPVKMTPNHGLHLSFRMLTFSNNVEPANGFLVRYLRRKLVESDSDVNANKEELLRVLDWVPKLWYHLHTFLEKHSTSDFLIGPCFFLSCPIGIEDFRTWFIDLWNNSIIPYLQEGAKDGIKVHGQKAAWEDPVEWVRDTLPWPSAQQDQSKLYHLPPPSVGPHSTASPPEDRTVKDSTPNSLDSDPLMAMLLKLQEAANYIESPDRETILDPNLQATL
ncbi:neuron navigator 1 isoform X3 [Mus musculus]|uniref:neuron navigator 1 isoform X3 n=1 Tax=Mus musculus TaxID=10090 RepID=UPI0003D701A9|nr:neuron navigator 1 isoform X3 [Mus musculus]|eukprot:XP_006529435.1 PREDICTED: neuron navigator 1 isoform X3 [Mus musculus]